MNVREFFVKCWKQEEPKFGKVLRALPADRLSYRPHERTNALGQRLEGLDDAKWNSNVTFFIGGNAAGNSTVEQYLWGFLHDMIHPRGQLTVYIRPMGGKVPGVYGPSGDEAPA